MSIEGGCHCGAVRCRVELPTLDDGADCHCTDCRALSGAAFTTWASVPLAAFAWTRGTPRAYPSNPGCRRWSCPVCGAQLAIYTDLAPQTLDIAVGTLDRPELYPLTRNVWVRSRLPWAQGDGLAGEDEEVL